VVELAKLNLLDAGVLDAPPPKRLELLPPVL